MWEPIVFRGIGLHTGVECQITLETCAPGASASLMKAGKKIPIRPDAIDTNSELATVLADDGFRVSTVEHLLSALNCYGLTDVCVVVDGPEIPALDGSALPFAEAFETRKMSANPRFYAIAEPVEVRVGDSVARVTPVDTNAKASITVNIDYTHPAIGTQSVTFRPEADRFLDQVAPARTFALESDVDAIRAAGLGLGGNLCNALIIGASGPLNPGGYRLPLEPARHKVLDALGDLFLTGGIPRAKLDLVRPGHRLMHALVRTLSMR